jgi:transcriptional regulator with XRE-family HTH domain
MNVIFLLFTFVKHNLKIMKERILEFLKRENKTSAQFAEEINVQPSGISHILSGRNNPSLDFVIKMLEKYSFISTDWLLFGKGSMYKEPKMADLFSGIDLTEPKKPREVESKSKSREASIVESPLDSKISDTAENTSGITYSQVIKIVWFYENKSFDEFYPRKD